MPRKERPGRRTHRRQGLGIVSGGRTRAMVPKTNRKDIIAARNPAANSLLLGATLQVAIVGTGRVSP
jgi:hypothetical protein